MHDKTDIWFINAHAKGDCRHHDDGIFAHKSILCGGSKFRRLASMIGDSVNTGGGQMRRDFVGFLARQAIDNPALTCPALHIGQQAFLQIMFWGYRE